MSHERLRTLLTDLADDVSRLPQPEYSNSAWKQAGRVRRRRALLGVVAAAALIAVPVALLRPDADPPVRVGYSETLVRPRAAHTATALPGGRVLIVGGCAVDGCSTAEVAPTTEFYVPGQGFVAGPELGQPRQGHSATLLADGRVLVAGGWAREGTAALASAEVLDPVTGRFAPVGSLNRPRGGHFAILLPDGRVLVVGGEAAASAELFDPVRDEFLPAAPPPTVPGGVVGLPDGRVLVVGGQDQSGAAVPGAIYDPASDTWQPTGALGTPRSKFAVAPLPDGRVLVLGGTSNDRILLRTTEFYDPGTGEFEPGPSMDTERFKFVDAVVIDDAGRVVVGGGTQVAVLDGERFRPVAGTNGPIRWVPTLTRLPDGGLLLVGGYDTRIRLHSDAMMISAGALAAATAG